MAENEMTDQMELETVGECHKEINSLKTSLRYYEAEVRQLSDRVHEFRERIMEARDLFDKFIKCDLFEVEAFDWIKKIEAQ